MTACEIRAFIDQLPKAELHLHVEGTLEPDLKLKLAQRNHIDIGQTTVEEVRKTYNFHDLPSFLSVYYPAMEVLQTEQDFYDLAYAYLQKAAANTVRHVEMFFDPQAHTSRGISFATVITGLHKAVVDAQDLGVDAALVMCFLRDYSKESARQTLAEAMPYKDWIVGVGLDSDEHNNPPLKFARQFEDAQAAGLHITAHCDVDQKDSIEHIKQALEIMGVERIDHGTNIVEDPDLVDFAVKQGIGITSCPPARTDTSPKMKGEAILELLSKGAKICVNSDDPAYFGGYINDNYYALASQFNLSKEQIAQLARNSFEVSWIPSLQKAHYQSQIDTYLSKDK
ncbi:adenine deaminase [Bombiscardovia apis]|uniref:Adenine deaminase n=1 Tax=Bombiscardovia apis TaxID=2932182 RepID=A0ABM8BCR7_9BIFI|nr:adenosine deaminase [Bombiscardovia apis]BDR54672.1 adenine deaminase [Bombiscardovia apis]